MFENLLSSLEAQGRKYTIYDRDGKTPYLNRWYVSFPDSLQRERQDIPFNMFIHQFMRSDDDTFHTHPWDWFHSTILEGGYWEHTPWGTTWYGPGSQRYVDCNEMKEFEGVLLPANLHWVEIPEPGKTWTMFTRGPTKQNGWWGFCPNPKDGRIIYHEDFLKIKNPDYYKNDREQNKTFLG